MPKYDYECTSCGQIVEVLQRMSDPPLTDCTCGPKGTLKRLLSAGSGLIFKGSGFYITDYKGGSGAPATGESAGESGTKTPATPAATPAPTPAAAPSTPSGGGHSCGGGGCGCS